MTHKERHHGRRAVRVLALLAAAIQLMAGQLVRDPLLPFERLNWGSGMDEVKTFLQNSGMDSAANFRTENHNGITLFFQAKIDSLEGMCAFLFPGTPPHLRQILLTLPAEQEAGLRSALATVREMFMHRFGDPIHDARIPLLGAAAEWESGHSTILLLGGALTSRSMVTILYRPINKQQKQ